MNIAQNRQKYFNSLCIIPISQSVKTLFIQVIMKIKESCTHSKRDNYEFVRQFIGNNHKNG